MSLAQKLKAARIAKGLQQQELADRIGVTQSAVSHVERGDRGLGTKLLEQWAEVCDHRLELIGSMHDSLLLAAAPLHGERLEALLRLARILPSMDVAYFETLLSLLDLWEKSSLSAADGKRVVKKM